MNNFFTIYNVIICNNLQNYLWDVVVPAQERTEGKSNRGTPDEDEKQVDLKIDVLFETVFIILCFSFFSIFFYFGMLLYLPFGFIVWLPTY
jgi:hypothetical protein